MSTDLLHRRDEVVPRVLAVAALVRLVAVAVGLATMLDRPLPPHVLVAVVLLAGSSYVGVSRRGGLALAARHPILCLVDAVLVLVVLAVVGPDSPIVLATLSTALMVGLLLRPAAATVVVVALAAGYLLVWHELRPDHAAVSFTAAVAMPLLYGSFAGVGLAVRSAQQRQAAAERELAASLTAAANERERARLAREMHDSLAKTLQGLSLGASALPAWVGQDVERAAAVARDLADGLDEATDQARALLGRLRADDAGSCLSDVVRRRVLEWARRSGHEATVSDDDVDVACPDVRYELLAVLGEALENVRRHAAARHVHVALEDASDGVRLRVGDDGQGLDAGAPADGRWGVVGMRERMAQVGGTLDLASRPGGGTVVTAHVPYRDVPRSWLQRTAHA